MAQIAAENSIHPNQIHKWKKQALEDFAQLFEDDRKGERVREAEHEKQLNELYAEIGRLSAQLSWLKKNLASTLSRAERLEMFETDHPDIPLKMQAELLGISYASLLYEPVPPSPRELAIKQRIDEIYTAWPFYGSRKIAFLLHPEFGVSRPTVQAYILAPAAPVQVCVKWAFLPSCRVPTRVNPPAAPDLPVLAEKRNRRAPQPHLGH